MSGVFICSARKSRVPQERKSAITLYRLTLSELTQFGCAHLWPAGINAHDGYSETFSLFPLADLAECSAELANYAQTAALAGRGTQTATA